MIEVLLLSVVLATPDTTFVFAQTSWDMTGDGVEEQLVLRAQGSATDSLQLTFTIHRGTQELYRHSFLVDRMIGPEGNTFASDSDWERVLQFYREFFAESRFRTPRDIVTALRAS